MPGPQGIARLSPCEQEAYAYGTHGSRQKRSAALLGVSAPRASFLASAVRRKLGADHKNDAPVWAHCAVATSAMLGLLGRTAAIRDTVPLTSEMSGVFDVLDEEPEGWPFRDTLKEETMTLITPKFLGDLNEKVGPIGLSAQEVEPTCIREGDEGFLVLGLDNGPQVFTIPGWKVEAWRRGFGGWLISHGKSVRFVRQKLTHRNLDAVVRDLNELSTKHEASGRRVDVRTRAVELGIRRRLPASGFYFADLEEQLAETVADTLSKVVTGRTLESQERTISRLRGDVSKFLNSFMIVRTRLAPEATEKLKGAQFKVTLGYPRSGVPVGTNAYFRDWFAEYLYDKSEAYLDARQERESLEGLGLRNAWGDGPFTATLACTSKGEPGDWVTMNPPQVYRDTPGGRIVTQITTPVMMAAQVAAGYNAKRTYREGNGWFNSLTFANPRPLDHCLKNGLEHYAGPDLDARRTEMVVCIGSILGVNVYEDGESLLNLDDINVTPRGHKAAAASERHRESMTAEDYRERAAEEFLDAEGRLKTGFSLDPNLVRTSSIRGRDVFTMEPTVYYPAEPDGDKVFKLLVEGSHKAMVKETLTHLCGVDARGNVYPIDLVVSGDSVRDKKLPYLPLSAVAGRAGIQYWDDFEKPVHMDRNPFEYDASDGRPWNRQYMDWANRHDDLVKAVARKLRSQGEDPAGRVRVYAWEPSLEDKHDPFEVHPLKNCWWNRWTQVGNALVGYCRVSRLAENERSSSKARVRRAVPRSPFLNYLANDESHPTKRDVADLNVSVESYRKFPQAEASDDDYEEESSQEEEAVLLY